MTSSMAASASSPFILVLLTFLLALACSLISPTDGVELVPDQWHEFEVPVVPEDKVRVRDNCVGVSGVARWGAWGKGGGLRARRGG